MAYKKAYWIFVFLISITSFTYSQSVEIKRKAHFNINENGVSINGYDPVSYHQNSGPKKGKKEISYNYKGIIYFFSSANNKALFEEDPEKYEPAYGGWCAYAIGLNGDKVEVDPKTFKIVDGKLNLFYNFYFNNTLKSWNKDEDKLKKQAYKNWIRVYK